MQVFSELIVGLCFALFFIYLVSPSLWPSVFAKAIQECNAEQRPITALQLLFEKAASQMYSS